MELAELIEEYRERSGENSAIVSFLEKIDAGTANYADVAKYAEETGAVLSGVFENAFRGWERIDRETAIQFIKPMLSENFNDVSRQAARVQKAMNTKAGISFNSVFPKEPKSRIWNYIDKLTENDLEKTDWLLGSDVLGNFARSVVTDTLRENAQFHKDAGLVEYIERRHFNCCDWCKSMAGRYVYGEQPDDFFRVHKDCTCQIIYTPINRRIEINRYRTNRDGSRSRITEYI